MSDDESDDDEDNEGNLLEEDDNGVASEEDIKDSYENGMSRFYLNVCSKKNFVSNCLVFDGNIIVGESDGQENIH